jgi:hypothetical protein
VGKLADLTVLSKDPYSIAPERLKDVKVEMTIVGGTVVHPMKQRAPYSFISKSSS